MNDTSNNRTLKYIQRSINWKYIDWQVTLLRDLWRIDDATAATLKTEFMKDIDQLDFKKTYELLLETEKCHQAERTARHLHFNHDMTFKYRQRPAAAVLNELKRDFSESIDQKLIQEIFKLFEEVPVKSKDFKAYGYQIFQLFIEFSERLEEKYSPETFAQSQEPEVKKPKEKIEGEEMGEKVSKKERKAKAALDVQSKPISAEPDLEGLPMSALLILFTFLTKTRLWHKLHKTPSASKKNRIEFMSQWFRAFKDKHSAYILTESCPYQLELKELRALRNKIYYQFEDNGHIFELAENGELQKLKEELDRGLDVDMRNGKRKFKGLLHIAALKQNFELIEMLEVYGADPNIVDRHLMTPLFFAIETKNLKTITKLLQMGADIEHKDEHNATPIYWSVYSADLPTLRLLAAHQANPLVICMLNRTCLLKAAFMDKWDMVEFLVGLPGVLGLINFPDQRGRTPLHAACWGAKGGRDGKRLAGAEVPDSPESLRILLDKGADVSPRDPAHDHGRRREPADPHIVLDLRHPDHRGVARARVRLQRQEQERERLRVRGLQVWPRASAQAPAGLRRLAQEREAERPQRLGVRLLPRQHRRLRVPAGLLPAGRPPPGRPEPHQRNARTLHHRR